MSAWNYPEMWQNWLVEWVLHIIVCVFIYIWCGRDQGYYLQPFHHVQAVVWKKGHDSRLYAD
jgi:hypothetical protein